MGEHLVNNQSGNGESRHSLPVHPIVVMRGDAGPFPGLQLGDVIAYEFSLPESFKPRPGKTQIERVFVLLDVGIQLANPLWWHGTDATTWYVDLVSVAVAGNTFTIHDQYIDVIVPTDGRHYTMLDLDEFADALASGVLSREDAVDALRRWQRFLNSYLHDREEPVASWTDSPPAAIQPLAMLPEPLAASGLGADAEHKP